MYNLYIQSTTENKKKYGGVVSEYCWFKKTKVLKRTCWKLKKTGRKLEKNHLREFMLNLGHMENVYCIYLSRSK